MPWPTVTLGDVADWGSGGTPKRSERAFFGPGVPWLSIADLDDAPVSTAKESLTPLGIKYSSAKVVPPGTLLIAMYGSIGKLGIAEIELCTSQAIAFAMPVHKRVDNRYLFHFLLAERPRLMAKGRGGTQMNIGQADLKAWPIPLPPLVEQRRIADILDRADALRAKRREALAHLDDLIDSIFLDMFGEPTHNDRGWAPSRVGDFVAGFESGKNLVAEDADAPGAMYRVLKVSAVTSGRFRADESKALPYDYVPPARHLVKDGDLLFSRANTTELVGATALVVRPPTNLAMPDKLWRFRWYPEPRADPTWVRHLFKRPAFRREVGKRATGTSGSMQNVSQAKILRIDVGLPPLADQRQFTFRAAAVERAMLASLAGSESLDLLFAALQHRAFAGEL